eukprot:5293305-Pleurochrysis_carterae.AAC.1
MYHSRFFVARGSHNSIHVAVGYPMTSVKWAAFHPIFFLHHCNVDRLYEAYLTCGRCPCPCAVCPCARGPAPAPAPCVSVPVRLCLCRCTCALVPVPLCLCRCACAAVPVPSCQCRRANAVVPAPCLRAPCAPASMRLRASSLSSTQTARSCSP